MVSSFKSIFPLAGAQPYFSNTTIIEFLSTSHGVRTGSTLWTGHNGIYLFPASSRQICHSGRTRMSALTYIRAYLPTYFVAQHKGYNDSCFQCTACVFFFSDIHLLLPAWFGGFSVLLRFHAFLIRLISYFSYCKYILSTSCCGKEWGIWVWVRWASICISVLDCAKRRNE